MADGRVCCGPVADQGALRLCECDTAAFGINEASAFISLILRILGRVCRRRWICGILLLYHRILPQGILMHLDRILALVLGGRNRQIAKPGQRDPRGGLRRAGNQVLLDQVVERFDLRGLVERPGGILDAKPVSVLTDAGDRHEMIAADVHDERRLVLLKRVPDDRSELLFQFLLIDLPRVFNLSSGRTVVLLHRGMCLDFVFRHEVDILDVRPFGCVGQLEILGQRVDRHRAHGGIRQDLLHEVRVLVDLSEAVIIHAAAGFRAHPLFLPRLIIRPPGADFLRREVDPAGFQKKADAGRPAAVAGGLRTVILHVDAAEALLRRNLRRYGLFVSRKPADIRGSFPLNLIGGMNTGVQVFAVRSGQRGSVLIIESLQNGRISGRKYIIRNLRRNETLIGIVSGLRITNLLIGKRKRIRLFLGLWHRKNTPFFLDIPDYTALRPTNVQQISGNYEEDGCHFGGLRCFSRLLNEKQVLCYTNEYGLCYSG